MSIPSCSHILLRSLEHFLAPPGLTAKEFAAKIESSLGTARSRIRLLADRGYLRSAVEKKGGSIRYLISDRGADARRAYLEARLDLADTCERTTAVPSRRAQSYLARHRAGWAVADIANHFKVSYEAVRKVILRWGNRYDDKQLSNILRNHAVV